MSTTQAAKQERWTLGYTREGKDTVYNSSNVYGAPDADGYPECIASIPGLYMNTTLAAQQEAAAVKPDVAEALRRGRLIAAAPELLAFVEAFVAAAATGAPAETVMQMALGSAKPILAKAVGQ